MLYFAANKKVRKKTTVNGPGYSFKIPEDFAGRAEDDPEGLWGYREYFQVNTFARDYDPQTNMFFLFWKQSKGALVEQQARDWIKDICRERVFSGKHSLELVEIFPIRFKRFPAFILKYKFSHCEPDAAGTASVFVINNTRMKKVFVLGALVEAVGSRMIENEALAWIEDQIISSFCFKKTNV